MPSGINGSRGWGRGIEGSQELRVGRLMGLYVWLLKK